MRIGNFVDSINEAMQKHGGGVILDFEIKIEDRLTGEFLSVDEVAIDAERQELRIVINTEASEAMPVDELQEAFVTVPDREVSFRGQR